jgi:hypothetical protein
MECTRVAEGTLLYHAEIYIVGGTCVLELMEIVS